MVSLFVLVVVVPVFVVGDVRVNLTVNVGDGYYNTSHAQNFGSGNVFRVWNASLNSSIREYSEFYTCGSGKYLNATPFRTISEDATQVSFGAWFKGKTGATGMVVTHYDTSNRRSWSLELDANTKPKVLLSQDGVNVVKSYTAETELDDNVWHNVIGVVKSNTLNIYVDGANFTTITKTTDNALTKLNASPFQPLVCARGTAGKPLGMPTIAVDNVVVWNESLTPARVAQYYAATSPQYGSMTHYYSSSTGNDAATSPTMSTPFKTISKFNSTLDNVLPGDTIAFKRGDVWRLTSDAYPVISSGAAGNNLSFVAYGTGAKPRFLGSYNVSNTTFWDNVGTNLWRTNITFPRDIGTLVFNAGTSNGLRQGQFAKVDTQGDFWRNLTDLKLYMYSVGNPGTNYSTIEATFDKIIFNIYKSDYVTLKDLEARYGGQHCVDTDDANVQVMLDNLTVQWCGGINQTSDNARIGNCIEFSLDSNGIIVKDCVVKHCFDACLSPQAWLSAGQKSILNHAWLNNQGTYCSYPFEFFNSFSKSRTENVTVKGNTFAFMGQNGFGTNTGRIRNDRSPVNTTNFLFYDNINYYASFAVIDHSDAKDWLDGYYQDYNLISTSTGSKLITFNGSNFTSVAAFQAAFPGHDHDFEADPYLTLIGDYYYPQAGETCWGSSTNSFVGSTRCVKAIFNQTDVTLNGLAEYDFSGLTFTINNSVVITTNSSWANVDSIVGDGTGKINVSGDFQLG